MIGGSLNGFVSGNDKPDWAYLMLSLPSSQSYLEHAKESRVRRFSGLIGRRRFMLLQSLSSVEAFSNVAAGGCS